MPAESVVAIVRNQTTGAFVALTLVPPAQPAVLWSVTPVAWADACAKLKLNEAGKDCMGRPARTSRSFIVRDGNGWPITAIYTL